MQLFCCKLTIILSVLVLVERGSCHGGVCEDPDTANAQTCETLLGLFENSLLSNGSNLYKLRKLFYPSTVAPPELVNITYYLRLTTTADESSSSPLELPACPCPPGAACLNRRFLNTSAELVTLRYGWTTAGIYTLVHPALLNQLQIQLPFALMRLISPDRVSFLWNGYNQLPSTSVHLTISTDKFKCRPDLSQVDGAMKTLTSFVSMIITVIFEAYKRMQ